MKKEKEMSKQKVYILTDGDYSDYHVVGVFSTRELAEDYVNSSERYEMDRIDEWEMDELQPDKDRKLFLISSDFNNIDCRIVEKDYYETVKVADIVCYRGKGTIRLCVSAVTREQAIKVAAERIRFVKAEEHIKFPLLRRMCTVATQDGYEKNVYPTYLFHTGEVLLADNYTLVEYVLPEALEPTLKVIRMSEWEERCKKEETK